MGSEVGRAIVGDRARFHIIYGQLYKSSENIYSLLFWPVPEMSASARGRERESHIYRFICHSPLALRPRHSCCVCWHFMWFAQQLQRDKTKQLPRSVLFARLLLRLLISVNRERSFVCPSSLGASLPIHVKLVCGFVRSIDTACQMHLCVARTQKKRC